MHNRIFIFIVVFQFDDSSTLMYHRESYEQPLIFSPPANTFFSKKNLSLKVDQANWSAKFPIDVAGSGGNIECVDNTCRRTYKV